jgi:hypothetical protein
LLCSSVEFSRVSESDLGDRPPVCTARGSLIDAIYKRTEVSIISYCDTVGLDCHYFTNSNV